MNGLSRIRGDSHVWFSGAVTQQCAARYRTSEWSQCALDSDKENSRLTQTAKAESSNPDHNARNHQHPNLSTGANE